MQLTKKEKMFALISEWESGADRRDVFCDRNGITLATFSYWRTKYRREGTQLSPRFIELKPSTPVNLEVVYPNGVIVRLPESRPLSDLQALIGLV
jgi:hypothetical protein